MGSDDAVFPESPPERVDRMKYDMTTPCAKCPFRKGTTMKLRANRIREIEGDVNQHNGNSFVCHETMDRGHEGDWFPSPVSKRMHCAGAFIYVEKHGRSSQAMRLAERFIDEDGKPLYDRTKLASPDLVWDNVGEWLEHGVG